MPRVPVTLVTGFLGSGKTTLINAVLRTPAFAGTLVIVNEFGEVGLDHLLVSESRDQVVLLDSGCLCCAASGSLRDTLIDLFAQRANGVTPAFDRIVVETSGLAHPGPLAATLIGDSALTTRCALAQVLTLVDAQTGPDTLARYAEARHQVAFADRLVISRTDSADASAIAALRNTLATMNADAPLALWHRDQPSEPLFAADDGGTVLGRPEVWLRNLVRSRSPEGRRRPDRVHGAAFGRIAAHVLHPAGPVDWATYAEWTRTLTARFGKRLLRCKGLLPLGDDGAPWLIQGVQGYFASPQRLAAWPAPDDAQGFLVCIGEAIPREELDAIITPDTSRTPHQSSTTDQP